MYRRLAPWARSGERIKRLVLAALRGDLRAARVHQIGKLTRPTISPLRFFSFLWYKQFTESICVAGWALFCNSRARPASKV
jgi:hypothetical protein